jgi:hypothetical protein
MINARIFNVKETQPSEGYERNTAYNMTHSIRPNNMFDRDDRRSFTVPFFSLNTIRPVPSTDLDLSAYHTRAAPRHDREKHGCPHYS